MTSEQRQIAAAKRLGVNRPIDEVLALARALLEFDASAASKRSKAGCGIGIAILLVIGGLVAAGNNHVELGLALAAVGVLGTIVTIVLYVRLRAEDLSDNLREAAVPFLAVLREDMNPGDPLHVNIDLSPTVSAPKLKKKSDPYKKGAYYKIVDSLYVDPWFDGSATLADGTKLRWKVIEHLIQQKKTKRTGNKIKSKTKIKRKTVATVTLAFATKEYAVEGDAQREEKRATVTLAKKQKSTEANSPAFQMLVDLIAEGYGRVKASA